MTYWQSYCLSTSNPTDDVLLTQLATYKDLLEVKSREVEELKSIDEQEKQSREREEASLRSALAESEKKIGEWQARALLAEAENDTLKANAQASHTKGVRRAEKFEPPTYEQVLDYMQAQRPNLILAEAEKIATKCFGYYRANGWKVGKNPMKSWEGGCQTFLSDIPKNSTVIPQRNAVHQRSTTGYGANSAASRLQTSVPDATAANPWGYPGG